MKQYKFLALCALIAVTASCDLTEKPTSFYEKDTYFDSATKAKMSVMGIYDVISTTNHYGQWEMALPSSDDTYYINGTASDGTRRDISHYTVTSTNKWLTAIWQLKYSGIDRASFAIAGIEGMAGYNESAELKALAAEARFLRAFLAFDLVKYWGDVPFKTTYSSGYVGIINAINLIDGVDGYSSGYTIVSSILFGVMFYVLGNLSMVALAVIVAISLLPFFLHNVFGKESKMFIGDAGTLSLGIIFSVFVTTVLSATPSDVEDGLHLGLIPFTLAVLCIPIFDTLRVMSARMLHGKSPFHPDKTHLHHLFIELGFSHIGTAMAIIGINLFIVLCWLVAYRCALSIEVQLYLVILLGFLFTFVFYPFMKAQIRKGTALYRLFAQLGASTHIARHGFWQFMQRLVDRSAIRTQ